MCQTVCGVPQSLTSGTQNGKGKTCEYRLLKKLIKRGTQNVVTTRPLLIYRYKAWALAFYIDGEVGLIG